MFFTSNIYKISHLLWHTKVKQKEPLESDEVVFSFNCVCPHNLKPQSHYFSWHFATRKKKGWSQRYHKVVHSVHRPHCDNLWLPWSCSNCTKNLEVPNWAPHGRWPLLPLPRGHWQNHYFSRKQVAGNSEFFGSKWSQAIHGVRLNVC